MDNNNNFQQPQSDFNNKYSGGNQPLPNATASLVLGILSIVVCYLGWILGIIGLVLANKDKRLYNINPNQYSLTSYNNSKTGRICSIIGIVLQIALIVIYYTVMYIALQSYKNYSS